MFCSGVHYARVTARNRLRSTSRMVGIPYASIVDMSLRRFQGRAITAELTDSVRAVAKKMREAHVGSVVATKDGRPIGIVTDRDLVLRVLASDHLTSDTVLQDIVTYDPYVLQETDAIETAVHSMREHGIRRLPIVNELGAVVGIVTADDLSSLLGHEIAMLGETVDQAVDGDETR